MIVTKHNMILTEEKILFSIIGMKIYFKIKLAELGILSILIPENFLINCSTIISDIEMRFYVHFISFIY